MIHLPSLLFLLALPLWIFLAIALAFRLPFLASLPRQLCFCLVAATVTLGVCAGVIIAESPGVFRPWHAPFFVLACGAFAAHVSFHVFNMSETARRIRILLSIRDGQALRSESGYSPSEMVRVRLKRLVELRQVETTGGIWKARTGILLAAALFLERMEWILFPERKINAAREAE